MHRFFSLSLSLSLFFSLSLCTGSGLSETHQCLCNFASSLPSTALGFTALSSQEIVDTDSWCSAFFALSSHDWGGQCPKVAHHWKIGQLQNVLLSKFVQAFVVCMSPPPVSPHRCWPGPETLTQSIEAGSRHSVASHGRFLVARSWGSVP